MAGIKREDVERVKRKIKYLKDSGLTFSEIAEKFGVSENFIMAVYNSNDSNDSKLKKTINVTDTFIAEITVCYTIPVESEMMTAKDYEMFFKSCYDDAHVRKLKHFIEE